MLINKGGIIMPTIVIAVGIFAFCGYVIGRSVLKRIKGETSCGCGGGCSGCGTSFNCDDSTNK